MIKVRPNKSFHYMVNIDCDTGHNGMYGSCDCPPDDYCRCGTIENARVTGISPWNANSLLGLCDGDETEKLLAFMFFRHCFDEDDFEVTTCRGYYGEEIDDVRMTPGGYHKINNFNRLLEEDENLACLCMILTHHYSYVRPEILQYKKWQLITIDTKDVVVPKVGAQQVDKSIYSHWDERSYPGFYPGCVVIPDKDKFKIIDGFHRWENFNSKKKRRKVKVLAPVT